MQSINIDKDIKYHSNGKIKSVVYKLNGFKHNPIEGKYAVTEYYESGILMAERSWIEGRKHGVCRHYNEDGILDAITHWYKNALHNLDGPAVLSLYPDGTHRTASWWRNDYYYSDDNKPVYVEYDTRGIVTKEFKMPITLK